MLEIPQHILVFYRDHFYPLFDRMTAQDGPFHDFEKEMHPELSDVFPVSEAPLGYFRRVRIEFLVDPSIFGT
ncbi:DUF4913 domain-containing protein [Glutamicibacter sp. MCAF14]|uniref:DUF4913 domain-containing protein n=1 Tax=Glutamicibacter sp. MCAF14 TaxID=3233043 RepID=UPI003F8EA3F5